MHFSLKDLNYDLCDYMIDYDGKFGAMHLGIRNPQQSAKSI